MFLTALPWEMSRSIIAAIADFMFVCVVCVCACMLQVCPALSLRPLPAFMFCFVCVWASARAVGWEMSRSIIAAVADFKFVCVVLCVFGPAHCKWCPTLSLWPLPASCYVLFVLCVFGLRVRQCPGLSLRRLPSCYTPPHFADRLRTAANCSFMKTGCPKVYSAAAACNGV